MFFFASNNRGVHKYFVKRVKIIYKLQYFNVGDRIFRVKLIGIIIIYYLSKSFDMITFSEI